MREEADMAREKLANLCQRRPGALHMTWQLLVWQLLVWEMWMLQKRFGTAFPNVINIAYRQNIERTK